MSVSNWVLNLRSNVDPVLTGGATFEMLIVGSGRLLGSELESGAVAPLPTIQPWGPPSRKWIVYVIVFPKGRPFTGIFRGPTCGPSDWKFESVIASSASVNHSSGISSQ